MKFIDLFSGIGGFRLGMEMAGHKCVGHCEIDKFANQSYEAIHKPKEDEWFETDITSVTNESLYELKDRGVEVICGGFPCQAFSIAGKRKGFDDTRGTLFFEIARFASILRPKYLFLENVKGLLNHKNGNTFETILGALDELGYDAEWQVLNSKNFGVPQNRERVFIVGHLRGSGGRKVFPVTGENKETGIDVIGNLNRDGYIDNSNRVYSAKGIGACLTQKAHENQNIAVNTKHNLLCKLDKSSGDGKFVTINNAKLKDVGCKTAGTITARYSKGICANGDNVVIEKTVIPVLTPDRTEKRQNGRCFKNNDEPMFTLTSQDRHGVAIKEATKKGYDVAVSGDSINFKQPNSKTRRGRIGKGVAQTLTTGSQQGTIDGIRIRRLTPKECFRLQGFPDWAFDRAKEVNSDSQLYKQAGNSVTVNVIYEIAKKLE